MSLKAFHFVFIVVAILLSIACSVIGWKSYAEDPEAPALCFGIGFAVLTVVMLGYGVWFFKKAKKIII